MLVVIFLCIFSAWEINCAYFVLYLVKQKFLRNLRKNRFVSIYFFEFLFWNLYKFVIHNNFPSKSLNIPKQDWQSHHPKIHRFSKPDAFQFEFCYCNHSCPLGSLRNVCFSSFIGHIVAKLKWSLSLTLSFEPQCLCGVTYVRGSDSEPQQ